ncbi:MAG: hypothetical protein CME65_07800 [Halobacteriovoraceae bacterium]|nr:hypothetical protein [Halobacteriovoraceae bacterium]
MHKVIILGFPLLFVLADLGPGGPRVLRGLCEKVLDGDTIVFKGQRVRLLGLDAPELEQRSRDGREIGLESKRFLSELIQGKNIELHYSSRDRYGRILGHLYMGGMDINRKILEQGYAVSFLAGRASKILEYQAKLKRRGIFSSEGFYAPSYYRRLKRKTSKELLDQR